MTDSPRDKPKPGWIARLSTPDDDRSQITEIVRGGRRLAPAPDGDGQAAATPGAGSLRERVAAALQRAHREWMRPGSDAGQHLMVDCLADAVLAVVHTGTDTGPAGEVAAVRAELDRIAELPTVTCDDGRADRFSTGARWTLRMIREVLNGQEHTP